MTPADMLADIGRSLYGERWRLQLARALGIDDDTIRRWTTNRTELRADHVVFADALALLRQREADIADMARRLEQWRGGKEGIQLAATASMEESFNEARPADNMTHVFVLRNGARVLDADTDQPGSGMLIRTVAGKICVSVELWRGDEFMAQSQAIELDKRGYLPPAQPMTREEFAEAIAGADPTAPFNRALWEVLGLGLPIGMAVQRAGLAPNAGRRMRRAIKALGWKTEEESI